MKRSLLLASLLLSVAVAQADDSVALDQSFSLRLGAVELRPPVAQDASPSPARPQEKHPTPEEGSDYLPVPRGTPREFNGQTYYFILL